MYIDFMRIYQNSYFRLLLLAMLMLCTNNLYANMKAGMPNPPSKPTEVEVGAFVSDIIDIDELNENFKVDMIMKYDWFDKRLAFDKDELGQEYKLFQGSFQVEEKYDGWLPQFIILNEVGAPERKALKIKVWYNGHVEMFEDRTLNIEAPMQLGKFPFDKQKLRMYMLPFADSTKEVVLKVDPASKETIKNYVKNNPDVNIAEWSLKGYSLSVFNQIEDFYGEPIEVSKIVVELDLDRKPTNIIWKLLLPLSLLVLGMLAIFWMDEKALSDRLNIAFIGILSIIAYQFLIEGEMPRIDYFTFTDSFLLISFAIVFMTIFESLWVYWLVKKGKQRKAHIVDIAFRMIFPASYLLFILLMYFIYTI